MAAYSIKDLENLSGIKAHTIRIWEKRYKIIQPERTNSNIRIYNDEDLKVLLNIAILNKTGMKISHIAQLSSKQLNDKVSQISRYNLKDDAQVENLLVSMIELNEKQFDKVLSNSILKIGFEETFIKILSPLFNRIGILWQTNSINPAQEHFITNLIRQKLLVAIDGQYVPAIANPKKFLLFLPEGELHEIGLLFAHYMIKKFGHQVVYLGQTVPIKDIIDIADIIDPHYLFTSYVNASTIEEINCNINLLYKHFNHIDIFITGLQLENLDINYPNNFIYLPNFFSFTKHLQKLSHSTPS